SCGVAVAVEWGTWATLPGGVYGTVRSILRAYDTLRRVSKATSYATSTGGTIRNEIEYTYDENQGVKTSKQDHNGAVDANTPYVEYTYDTSVVTNVFDDGLRLTGVRTPSAKNISLFYDSTF